MSKDSRKPRCGATIEYSMSLQALDPQIQMTIIETAPARTQGCLDEKTPILGKLTKKCEHKEVLNWTPMTGETTMQVIDANPEKALT